MTIRIGIVDNDPYALTVMKTLIERLDAGFEVIWTTDIGAVAISRCVSTAKRPDVLVTDMAMAGADGPEISRAIRARTSQVGIVGVTSYTVSSFREAAAFSGMQALVAKTDIANLRNAICDAAQGKAYRMPIKACDGVEGGRTFEATQATNGEAVRFMDLQDASNYIEDQQYARQGKLSNKERETFRLYADGLNTKEIAGRMGVSVATVATFERRATMKLNARSRAHAIAICIRRHEF